MNNSKLISVSLFFLFVSLFCSSKDQSYLIEIDYSQSIIQMLVVGGYDANTCIHFGEIEEFQEPFNENKGKIETRVVLVQFYQNEDNNPGEGLSSNEVFRKMDEKGLRSAGLAELIVFGAKYPDMFLKINGAIHALGTTWNKHKEKYYAYLYEFRGRVCICSEGNPFNDDWEMFNRDDYFLAVKK